MKNKFLKNCLALFLITLVAGVSLAFVNEIIYKEYNEF